MGIKFLSRKTFPIILSITIFSCKTDSNREMVDLLATLNASTQIYKNGFSSDGLIMYYDSLLKLVPPGYKLNPILLFKGVALLNKGREDQSVLMIKEYLDNIPADEINKRLPVMRNLAMAYLRLAERTNCMNNHGASSCVFPLKGTGIHTDKGPSLQAIEVYKEILKHNPDDMESRWLMNIAYMTTAQYPEAVPPSLLIPGLDIDTSTTVRPFRDIAVNLGLDTKNMAGGAIIDDFNNDGYLDMVTSSWGLTEGMHYCRNNGDGTFTDESEKSGLKPFTGGLNIMQTDYNNDGFKDIFVLRGAWKKEYGREPNSLLRNNGNGTFTDVTKESGLLSFHPTQAATWNDFNNDGWLDVFIGNETTDNLDSDPSEFYINNKNGTFTEVSAAAGCKLAAFVKGVTSGDYNKDGLADICISTLNGFRVLLQNTGNKNGIPVFKDVTQQAGLNDLALPTFPLWFWDYDNDGWLDILVCGYKYQNTLAHYAALEALGKDPGPSGQVVLYRNKQDGTFENVSVKMGLNKLAFAMGSNFGDIDNDGYLDFYLGTGNPNFQSLVPNKLFKNERGAKFADITSAARVGNLQKGHAVSFSDIDNDGDEDIFIEMGGAFEGDAYQNSLYINPGQNNNNWVNLSLQGVTTNKAAIGAKIKVVFDENGIERSVYREVNSGGSFGSNPLRQHIGIGQAKTIKRLEITWPVSKKVQTFTNLGANVNLSIVEDNSKAMEQSLTSINYLSPDNAFISCAPK